MADDLQNRVQHWGRISLARDWEVRRWSQEFGVTDDEVRDIFSKVDPGAQEIDQYLAKTH